MFALAHNICPSCAAVLPPLPVFIRCNIVSFDYGIIKKINTLWCIYMNVKIQWHWSVKLLINITSILNHTFSSFQCCSKYCDDIKSWTRCRLSNQIVSCVSLHPHTIDQSLSHSVSLCLFYKVTAGCWQPLRLWPLMRGCSTEWSLMARHSRMNMPASFTFR